MADNEYGQQLYDLSITGANKAQKRYLKYYNQIRSQLTSDPYKITAQVIADPEKMQAQQIEAPDKIQAERVDMNRMSIGEAADELDAYFRPYLQNSMRQIRQDVARQRAAVDADAYARGMGSSTYLSDQKNELYRGQTNALENAMSEYYNQLGQRAVSVWDANENRWLQAQLQNAANQLTADELNASYANRVAEFNANALMNADQYNIDNLLKVAMQNAQYAAQADQYNSGIEQWLEELAWGRAGQMYKLKPKVRTVVKTDNSGVAQAPLPPQGDGNDARVETTPLGGRGSGGGMSGSSNPGRVVRMTQ